MPPLVWQAERAPTVTLVWADAATPDTPLDPQPVSNISFCAQSGGPPSGG
ncbi:putative outer membrane protein, partial [Salmonella enterica subsp. enterica serovar Baildon str. R6-199]